MVGLDVSLPVSLLTALTGSATVVELDLRTVAPPPADGLPDDLRLRAAFTNDHPRSKLLPFSYQRVPPQIRWYIGRYLGSRLRTRRSEWARFPDWPLDLSADFVAD